jgi:AAA domain
MKALPQDTTVSNHWQSLGDAPRAVVKDDAYFAREAAEYRERKSVEQAKDPAASKPVVRAAASACASRFVFVDYASIRFDPREEWLVKDLLPRQGVMTLYGQSCSFKSFVLLDWSVRIAAGWPIAGRSVAQGAVCYICAEGGNGFRKRVEGLRQWYGEELPATLPFRLLTAAPNLGTDRNDLDALIAAVESAGAPPAMIVIDTLNKVLGGGDENNQGMVAVLGNATELTRRFNCAVILIHHEGHAKQNGAPGHARGHSSLMPSMDAHAHIQRKDDRSAIITMRNIKDEDPNVRLKVTFRRIVVGTQDDGSETSTLVVSDIAQTYEAMPSQSKSPAAKLPDSSKLMMTVIKESLEGEGKLISLGQGAAKVKGVAEDVVRREYYARLAEDPRPNETPAKLADRQRQSFGRGLNGLLNRELVLACTHDDQRYLCLPGPAPTRTATAPYKGGRPSRPASDDAKGTGCVQMISERVQSRPDVLHELEHNSGRSGTRSDAVQSRPDVLLGVGNDTLTDACDYLAQLDGPSLEADALVSLADALTEGRDDDALPVSAEVDDVEWLSYEPDDVTDDPPDVQPPPWLDRDFYPSIPSNPDRPPLDVDESDEASS